MDLLLLLVPLAPFLLVRLAKNWRQTLFFMMVFLVLEGAIRKWFLPQFQAQIYFVKDALLVLAVVGFALERRTIGRHVFLQSGLRFWLLAYLVFCILQVINPNNPSLLLWAVGAKSHLLYIALMFVVPYAFSSGEQLERVFRVYATLMIPLVAVGMVQFFAPADSFLNLQVIHDADSGGVAPMASFGVDNRARASGTFAYVGSYATFVTTMFLFALPSVLVSSGSFLRNWPGYVLLIVCATCSFATGSRAVLLMTFGAVPFVLLLSARVGLIQGTMVVRVVIGAGLVLLAIAFAARDAVDAMVHRSENSDDPITRLLSPFTELFESFVSAPLFGTGLGTNHNASASIMRSQTPWWLDGNVYELETARIMQECGAIGFVLVYGLRVGLIVVAIRMLTKYRSAKYRSVAISIAVYGAINCFYFIVSNPSVGIYYWCSIGLLFAMYRLEAIEAGACRAVKNETTDRWFSARKFQL